MFVRVFMLRYGHGMSYKAVTSLSSASSHIYIPDAHSLAVANAYIRDLESQICPYREFTIKIHSPELLRVCCEVDINQTLTDIHHIPRNTLIFPSTMKPAIIHWKELE